MESLSELYEALNQVSNSDYVQLLPYQLDIHDVVCGSQARPLFAMCLPLEVAAIANLFKNIPSTATLTVSITSVNPPVYSTATTISSSSNRHNVSSFTVEISYYSNLQHRITGNIVNALQQLPQRPTAAAAAAAAAAATQAARLIGQYRIESFSDDNDYQLLMTFVDGLADDDAVVKAQDELQQFTYNRGVIVSKLTYQINVDEPNKIDIFNTNLSLLPLVPITMEEYRISPATAQVRMSSLFTANGTLIKRTVYDYNSNGDVISNSVDANDLLDASSITNSCGKVVRDQKYDPNKSYGITHLSDSVMNSILSQLSRSESFTGLLPVIYSMLASMRPTSVSDKVVVNHATVNIEYGNVINVAAYTIRGYKSYTFDQDGHRL